MKKFLPVIFLGGFIVVAFVFSVVLNKPSDAAAYAALDQETQRIIQQDHVIIQMIVNYLEECQKKGVLPVPQAPNEEEKK